MLVLLLGPGVPTVVVVMKSALHSHLFSLRFFLHLDLSVDGGAYAVCLGTA
jgi:hypothetical protein